MTSTKLPVGLPSASGAAQLGIGGAASNASIKVSGERFRALLSGPSATRSTLRDGANTSQIDERETLQRQQQRFDSTPDIYQPGHGKDLLPSMPYAAMPMTHFALLTTQLPPVEAGGPTPAPENGELVGLLQQVCTSMHVDTQASVHGSRMLLALDAALPGAAAELVREGAFLRIRLHARNDTAFRLMSAQRDALNTSLDGTTPLQVRIEVIRDGEAR